MTKVETIKRVVTSKPFAVITSSVVAAAASAVVSVTIVTKRVEKKYSDISAKEIAEAKQFYIQKYKDANEADLEKLAAKYVDGEPDEQEEQEEVFTAEELAEERNAIIVAAEILEKQQYVQYNKPPPVEVVELVEEVVVVPKAKRRNIFGKSFDETDVEFDESVEEQKKLLGKPYILTEADFMANEDNMSSSQLTYYEGDGVLADERDGIIDDVERRIGGDINLRFGYGSNGDRNVVYIASPALDALYEVVRSNGSFAEEVYGMTDEDEAPPVPKMRKSDGY